MRGLTEQRVQRGPVPPAHVDRDRLGRGVDGDGAAAEDEHLAVDLLGGGEVVDRAGRPREQACERGPVASADAQVDGVADLECRGRGGRGRVAALAGRPEDVGGPAVDREAERSRRVADERAERRAITTGDGDLQRGRGRGRRGDGAPEDVELSPEPRMTVVTGGRGRCRCGAHERCRRDQPERCDRARPECLAECACHADLTPIVVLDPRHVVRAAYEEHARPRP